MRTRVFGRVRADLVLPVSSERVTWGPLLAFPGLRPGEGLSRRSEPPLRGTLLSRDGKVLAKGPPDARTSPLEAIAGSIAGTIGADEAWSVVATATDAGTASGSAGVTGAAA